MFGEMEMSNDYASQEGGPLVSLVVLAFNKLEYTRQCIESIYRYTSHISFELITINNGSTDGTAEYFESLPNAKKLSFPENIGVCKAFNRGFALAEGKYTMNISNDIIVTANWLDNLLICLETDPSVGLIVPVCNASCNYQQVGLNFYTMEEMQAAAKAYNVSNPHLWEERLKLIIYTGIYPTDILKKVGGFDEDFNPGCYDDDAISFSIRRMGYKTLLAKDTFVYHFGARTFNAEYVKDTSLAMRNKILFVHKFGVDPYVAGLIDYSVLDILRFGGEEEVAILGLGLSYGTTALQIKNFCNSHGSNKVDLYYLSGTNRNMVELKTICKECAVGTVKQVSSVMGGRSYDYILVEYDGEALPDRANVLGELYGLLKPGGQLVCASSTPKSVGEILWVMGNLGASFDRQRDFYYFCFSKPVNPLSIS